MFVKNIKNQILLFVLLVLSFISNSCKKDFAPTAVDGGFVEVLPAAKDSSALELPTQLWHVDNRCICVLFGYGYNDSDFVSSMEAKLFENYGNFEENGLVLSLVFPDDFKRGSKAYISYLTSVLEDKNISGIILLGAPEGTYSAIARLQDLRDQFFDFPIISLFSQDDVLAMEDSADFVLDKAQRAEINGLVAETEQSFVSDVPELLIRAVRLANLANAPFKKNSELYEIVKNFVFPMKVSRYVDPETGLISINHFVLE